MVLYAASIFFFVFPYLSDTGASAFGFALTISAVIAAAMVIAVCWAIRTRRRLVRAIGRLSVDQAVIRIAPSMQSESNALVCWQAPRHIAPVQTSESVGVTEPDSKLAAYSAVTMLLALVALPLAINAYPPWMGLLVGVAILPLRAFAFNPLRAMGRWAIIADPEKIEIPNWIRGVRTFRWERSTLVIIGVYGQMARAAVVDRDTGDTVAFNLPRANLDTLVGVATARR